jgi:type IV pilus assembly protein PilY1
LSISGSAERSLNKPVVLGGLSLFSAFTPISDVCSFGGSSRFYSPYFESGTAYKKAIFTPGIVTVTDTSGNDHDIVLDSIDLGDGTTSSPGIHVGQQEGGKVTGYVQQGTGAVVDFDIDPALKVRSGIRSWIER